MPALGRNQRARNAAPPSSRYTSSRRRKNRCTRTTLPRTTTVVRGKVVRVHRFFRRLLDVYLEEGGAALRARWFRPNAGMAKAYEKGKQAALAGKLRRNDKGEAELIHPSNVTALQGEGGTVGIRARYPRIEGVPGRTVEKLIAAAVSAVGARAEEC